MMDVLQNSIYFIGNSLFIIGFWTSCKRGMILGFIRDIEISEWLKKPLYICPPCMASIWGSLGFIIACLAGYFNLVWLIPYVVALAGFNKIIVDVVPFYFDDEE